MREWGRRFRRNENIDKNAGIQFNGTNWARKLFLPTFGKFRFANNFRRVILERKSDQVCLGAILQQNKLLHRPQNRVHVVMNRDRMPISLWGPRNWPAWAFIGVLVFGWACSTTPHAMAQEENPTLEKERQNAERFLQVLRRRPRPGTALDRVYGFHVQNGSLDDFVKELNVPDDAEDAGQQQMILGLLQLQRGRPALAVDAFTKAEGLLSNDGACSYYLGRSLLAVGQTEKAAEAMERAIERKPARNEALPIFTELGRIYGRAGQSEKALNVWQKLEALFPGDPKVGGQIARTFAEEGNVEEALERYEKLAKTTRKDEDKVAFAVQAAEMQRRLGKSDEATAALEMILSRLRPGSWLYTDVRNRIEDGFLKSGDYDSLAEYYKKKLADDDDNLSRNQTWRNGQPLRNP